MPALRLLLLLLFVTGYPLQDALAERVVLFLGDSLTAGLGVEPEEAYPRLLGALLTKDGVTDVRIVNGGVSGSTSASALSRLQWYDKIRPSVLFLALGANDGLRGLTVEEMGNNLAEVIDAARKRGMSVILAGMELPPNYGDEYTGSFRPGVSRSRQSVRPHLDSLSARRGGRGRRPQPGRWHSPQCRGTPANRPPRLSCAQGAPRLHAPPKGVNRS